MFQFLIRLSALILATGVSLPAQQTVWFAPLPYGTQPTGMFGSTDYLSLFSPSAPWQEAASHVQVFKLYGDGNFSDTDLTNLIANLKSRNIALALEWPVLSSNTCGAGLEGFGSSLLPFVQRIQSLGGTLSYVAMEQPFEWGSLYQGAGACQWTAEQVATNALAEINAAKAVFPSLLVGDIMAVPSFPYIPDWVAQYATWLDTWRSVTGAPLAFFHVDVDWSQPYWQAAVAAIRPAVEQRGVPFGMVYNGFLTDESDSAWMADAENHFVDFEVTSGYAPPEQVDFQSWNPSPTHLLPETDPTAFTYLIDRYFRTRTNLTLTNNGTQIGGNLTSGGQGVANASVQLTSQALSGSGTIATYTLTGAVPNEAVMALVGARVNTECYACNGASDLTVYEFQYNDSNASELNSNEWDFSNALSDWTTVAPSPAVFTSGPAPYRQGLHITAQPGQTALLNSTFTGVSPGGQFTFQVTARVAPLSVGSGYFTLIWLDANQTEPSREIILFEPQTQMLTTATTAADGSFIASIPVDPNLYQVTAQYAGSSALWPSSAVVPSSPSSPPSIVSLTPAAGSGASAAFSAVFNDPNGWGAIANAQVLINTGPFAQGGCDIGYLPLTRTFQLLSDTGVWSSMVLSNNECSVSGMSASGSGNNLTLNFTVNFLASSRAQESVFLQVNDSQGLTVPWASAGTWSIVPTACTLSGATNLTDVQSTINQALGGAPAITDMNGDGTVNVVDVELVVSGFLGCAPFNSAAPAGSGTRTMAHSADRRERL